MRVHMHFFSCARGASTCVHSLDVHKFLLRRWYTRLHEYLRACGRACVRACVCACVHVCMRACMRACVRVCMLKCVCAYVHVCVHACACVLACVCCALCCVALCCMHLLLHFVDSGWMAALRVLGIDERVRVNCVHLFLGEESTFCRTLQFIYRPRRTTRQKSASEQLRY